MMRTINDMIKHVAPATNEQSRNANRLIAALDREVARFKLQHADQRKTKRMD